MSAITLLLLGVWLGSKFSPFAQPRSVVVHGTAAHDDAPASSELPALAPSADRHELRLAAARPKRARGAIDVVLIVWDTVRRDELEPYGSEKPSSPFVAALAREGVTFANAYSTSSWTVPAMYSMMTGLYPSEHGIVTSTIVGTDEPSQIALPEAAQTLAESLKQAGYLTFGVSTNLHLARRFGFAQGFDYFVGDGFHFSPFPRVAIESLREAILDSDKYFLWLHYFDPHFPYTEREPWFQQWNDSPLPNYQEVALNAAISDYWRDRREPPGPYVPPNDVVALTQYIDSYTFDPIRLYDALTRMTVGPGRDRARNDYGRYLRAAYRSEVRAIDADVEHVFARLGIDDQTLVILTADHGEEFFDHDRLGHRLDSLHQELISIPLVVRLPGGAHRGTVVTTPVSLVDLMPSVLELAQAAAPADVSGRSFAGVIENDAPQAARDLVSELTYLDGSEHRALIRYPWKYIHNHRDGTGVLYDIVSDPGERIDRASDEPERAAVMRAALEAWVAAAKPRWPSPQTPAVQSDLAQKLRALGYTASPGCD